MSTVLVVDDSPVDRRLTGGLLEKNPDLKVEYAESGMAALTRMDELAPEVVVTDLLMPDMDGIELVRSIRARYPNTPVILVTGHGSETLAMDALDQGAASYVPKSQLAEKLLDTIEQVMAVVRADQTYQRLVDCAVRTEFTYVLDNDPKLIDPLVDLIQQIVYGMKLCDPTGRFRIGVALTHALLNALYRGNLEISFDEMREARENLLRGETLDLVSQRSSEQPYCDRRIHVDVRITCDEAQFVIRDDGNGFDVSGIPAAGDPSVLESDRGRGLVLIRAFMDTVAHNDKGNEITLIKRRETHEPLPH